MPLSFSWSSIKLPALVTLLTLAAASPALAAEPPPETVGAADAKPRTEQITSRQPSEAPDMPLAPARVAAPSGFRPALGLRLGRAGHEAGDDTLALLSIAAEAGFAKRNVEALGALEFAPSTGGICHYCTGWRGRFGAVVRVHLAPDFIVDPWVGGGGGFELLWAPEQSASRVQAPMAGVYGALHLGVDLRASPGVRVGPYAAGSAQMYLLYTDGSALPAWATEATTSLEVGLRLAYMF